MTKPRALFPISSCSASVSELGINRSQAIAKLKPKIRVIHVDAPKIIQTDAAYFRDLVQRLTGKPGDIDQKTPPTSKDLIMEKVDEEEEEDFLGLRNGKKEIKNEDEDDDDDDDDEIPKRRSKSNKEMRLSSFFDHQGFSELDGSMEQLGTMN
ncbi:hypothetical protein QN277_010291 [Acacia crassicarpa]|uniref:VQ domain-containing protein n=1 Tax=Acacia crassicarpa TaxID=499986 RepID=A0AAE1M8R8_9FABA|nr:hypothetical protein QN277_010291 [Acacia crassicarpa]